MGTRAPRSPWNSSSVMPPALAPVWSTNLVPPPCLLALDWDVRDHILEAGTIREMIERFGMFPSIFVAVFLGSLADTNTSIWQKLTISVAVPAVCVAIFKYGLSLNVDVIRWRP